MPPKRKREISGVTASSMIDLKAVLFAEQERSRGVTLDNKKLKARSSGAIRNVMSRQNRGIRERLSLDEAVYEKEKDPLGASAEKLKEKSILYDKLAQGIHVGEGEEDDYLIDFEYKQLMESSGVAPAGESDNAATIAAEFLKQLAGGDGPGRDAADLRRDAGGAVIISSAPKEIETEMDRRRREWEVDAKKEDDRERELEIEDLRRKHRHTLLDSLHEQTERERANMQRKKEKEQKGKKRRANELRKRAALQKHRIEKAKAAPKS